MRMADSDGCGIVGARNRGQAKQDAHHLPHLLLFRVPMPGHCELHLRRGVLGDGETTIGKRQHDHPARMAHCHRRLFLQPAEHKEYRMKSLSERIETTFAHGLLRMQKWKSWIRNGNDSKWRIPADIFHPWHTALFALFSASHHPLIFAGVYEDVSEVCPPERK